MKKSFLFLSFVLLAFSFACKKDSNKEETTELTIRMTDAPFNATEVNVEILQVRAKFTDDDGPDGWYDLNTRAGIYNLLTLQNGIDTALAQGIVPLRTLKEIRFVLGNRNSILINNVLYPLTIPSGSESGLKIKLDKKLNARFDFLLLDFDAQMSIIQTGNGEYKLKPVIKIK
ncbi:MAG: DUF4382 domain-containing protein [Gemmatimonadaceae bacterium]|nr:DUF4382 domain-containing protein [Chitinophagaceae bacterium]